MNLCDDATFYFIHIVEEFPTLWDLSRADYADVAKKQSIWEHIVEEMKKWPTDGPYSIGVGASTAGLMPTVAECICCKDIAEIRNERLCVTLEADFEVLCLNTAVLRVAYIEDYVNREDAEIADDHT
ncbi:hypothetical protein MTO96_032434 [Rhipicephalus appendiculatus]